MEWYEVISVIIAGGGMAIAILGIHHRQKMASQAIQKEQLKELVAHQEWKKNMEFKVATIEKETEKMKEDGKFNLHNIWQKIEAMESSHDKDLEETNKHINNLITEITKQNHCLAEKTDKNYSTLLAELNKISSGLAVITAQFDDHKNSHANK